VRSEDRVEVVVPLELVAIEPRRRARLREVLGEHREQSLEGTPQAGREVGSSVESDHGAQLLRLSPIEATENHATSVAPGTFEVAA